MVATQPGHLRHPLPTRSRTEGAARGVSRVRRPALTRAARCAGSAGQDLPGILPSGETWREGEKAGFPRFQGRGRYHSFTYKEYGNGVQLDNGFLVLSKIGRIAVKWARPLEGTPKTVTISKE